MALLQRTHAPVSRAQTGRGNLSFNEHQQTFYRPLTSLTGIGRFDRFYHWCHQRFLSH